MISVDYNEIPVIKVSNVIPKAITFQWLLFCIGKRA